MKRCMAVCLLVWNNRQPSNRYNPMQKKGDNLIDELIEDMVGDSFVSTGNDDWKEAAWQRKLRRQIKVNLRRRKR